LAGVVAVEVVIAVVAAVTKVVMTSVVVMVEAFDGSR